MKTRILFLISIGIAGLFQTLPAQSKCYDYDCMIKMAREYIQNKDFGSALISITAAKRYSNANEVEADALINIIFEETNQLRRQAEEARIATEKSAALAEAARIQAERARVEAEQQRNNALMAREQVEYLVNKGMSLENTFSDTNAYDYLYQTGLRYFQWNKAEQCRDYRNAQTYFALARFLKPSDILDYLIAASKNGIGAEDDFIHGDLDSAREKYAMVQSYVQAAHQQSDFEAWRMNQIREVDDLFRTFRQKHDFHHAIPDTLEGNWWTLPSDFQKYQAVTSLVFKNNPATFRQFPTVLSKLPHLELLAFVHCQELRQINDWEGLSHLTTLVLKDNLNLYSLEQLGNAASLISLDIDNCPALTHIEGSTNLEGLVIKNSPQAHASFLLQNNKNLKKLELADLPEASFDSENLRSLEYLSLSRMNMIRQLEHLDKNIGLRALKIDHLSHLQGLTPPGNLTTVHISHCDSLVSLGDWPQSDSLEKFVLAGNTNLKSLPDWSRFPKLKNLLIQDNHSLKVIKGIKSLTGTDQLFLLNNPHLITNSVHAGFGFDWGILNLSSFKLEFEHRRTIPWLKESDLGFKAIIMYGWKQFNDESLYNQRKTNGFITGFVTNYYSPHRIYVGIGMGAGYTRNEASDQSFQWSANFVWINNLGIQISPYFLKKDKLSINMDLYTIFVKKGDYYIMPTFGLTYYYTLDFNNKTYFIRPSDSRRHLVRKWRFFGEPNKERIDALPERF